MLEHYLFSDGSSGDPPPYVFPPRTTEDLEYADLATVDLSKASTYEGRIKLAAQVSEAMTKQGFF